MIKFENIHPDVVNVLQREGIKEADLKTRYSDLQVGCSDFNQATRIKEGGIWKSMSSCFTALNGSDMDHYMYVVEIPFAAMDHHLKMYRVMV